MNQAAWKKTIEDVVDWCEQLDEVMCSLQAVRSGLGRGAKQVDPPLPGGQALALKVPAADRTDPESVVRDYALMLRRDLREPVPLHRPLRGEGEYLLARLQQLQASPWASVCWRELESAWRELGKVTGHLRLQQQTDPTPPLRELADRVPDSARLTLSEADKFWPGVSARVRTARSRDRVKKRRDPAAGPAQPDENRRYLVQDLRRWHLTPKTQVV